MLDPIHEFESDVRGYVRLFPRVFERALGSELWDRDGNRFIDFFCGAGTLNYGHNNPNAKQALVEYIQSDGIQHGLDTATVAKISFIEKFQDLILKPRGLDFKLQFTGPTGTNAVEAAIKLARLSTQRSHIVAFTHAYHGHSLGALALTGNSFYHSEYFASRNNVTHFPFDNYHPGLNSAELLRQMLTDPSSGIPLPAAIVLETVQGEGGVNVASCTWLKQIQAICDDMGILLIVDDIQVGNGRTGQFFSFEASGIQPDLVCLSKSLGGGLPFSLVLIKPEHDAWKPGQHTGTFRGNNLAFVAATALLDYWKDDCLSSHVQKMERLVASKLSELASQFEENGCQSRGRGLIYGLDVGSGKLARRIIDLCFGRGLMLEATGAHDEVLKVMPALTISEELLHQGLCTLERSVCEAFGEFSASSISHSVNISPLLQPDNSNA